MAEEKWGWWRAHGWTVVLLFTAFGIALLIRTLWAYPLFAQDGWLYIYGGGSDSFYHSRVMSYIILNHTNLVTDCGLRYPQCATNPREPLFDWMNAILGTLFQGAFTPQLGQPASVVAGSFFLDWDAPFWAAMGVFPVYLLGKEVTSRRMGLIAAFLYPFMVSSIESTALGYANYLSFYAFVMLITVYAYIRMIRAVGTRRWVTSYRRPRDIATGIRNLLKYERAGVKWAVFTGVCLGALALTWQGYPFFIAALVVFLVVQMIVERIRRVDSFSLYVNTWIVGLVGFPMAMPYYFFQSIYDFQGWFDTPLLVFFGALLILVPFLLLRDSPWVVSVPVLLLTGAIAIGGLALVDRTTFTTIVTGQGYFVKTLVYSTVAEAQAPSIDSLILGFGVLTFFMAFVGLALLAIKIGRQRFRREHVMFFVFAFISVYLPITAAKFFLLGSAAFALLAAEVLVLVLDVAGYPSLRRNVVSLSDRRSQFTAFRRSFKARHILVMALILVIVVPNIWYAVDAGIPYNSKTPYNNQIFSTLPPPLRTSASNASSFYLGAAGTSLDTPNQYDEAGYNWLATQDQNLPLVDRPAFVSWWDYGFQALSQGQHPTVADNFQNGIDPAGQFLLSQNESDAIAILTIELLHTEQVASGNPYLPSGLNALLSADGLNLTTLHTLMVNTSADVPLVVNHPERYLPVSAGNLDPQNAMYYATTYYIATALPLTGVAKLYDDVQAWTGWSIRYAMVDSRLFPFSGSNTGIFYAPADLTDRVIGAGGTPSAFFNVTVVGSDGNTYPAGSVPASVTPVNYNINYFAPFYNSMIYRTFIGYNGTDVGQGAGIPGLSGSAASDAPEPGWMLQHFQVVYRTAYYCPYSNPSQHPNCFSATNLPTAQSNAKAHNGSADTSANSYFSGGEAMLAYYPGQPYQGTVALPDGSPVANARLTVYDGWGIPHMTTVTGKDGSFSLLLPPGNDTVNVTSGAVNGLTQAGGTSIDSIKLVVSPEYGYSLRPVPLVQTITVRPGTVGGLAFWNVANNTTYNPSIDSVAAGAVVNLWSGGAVYHLTTDASGTFEFGSVAPGVYNASVVAGGANYTQPTVYVTPAKALNESFPLTPGSVSGVVYTGATATPAVGAVVTVYSSHGAVASQISTPTGNYTVKNLGPGNYSVIATNPGTGLGSISEAFTIAKPGAHLKVNLTLVPVRTVVLTVRSNGVPVGGFLVRLTPFLVPPSPVNTTNHTGPGGRGPGPNSTHNSTPTIPSGIANSTTYVTPANGTIIAQVPADNYTVYGAGLSGSSLLAGLSSLYLPGNGTGIVSATLTLGPGYVVHGLATTPGGSSALVTVQAFGPGGDSVAAPVNSTGAWILVLPAGTYGLEGTTPVSAAGASYAALQSLTVPASGVVPLSLAPAEKVSLTVGAPQSSGIPFPAAGALVVVTAEPSGARVSARTTSAGTVTLLVPSALPAGESYCLNITAPEFSPYGECGLTAGHLGQLSSVSVTPVPVPTTATISGYPSGAVLHLNFTANGAPAVSTDLVGGPTFHASLSPGRYLVTAYASNTSALYRPIAPFNLTIPFGAPSESLSITLYQQLKVVGSLSLPAGATAADASVSLQSAGSYLNLTGAAFTGGFLAAAGTYTVSAAITVKNTTYANVTTITVNPTGTISGRVDLTTLGGTLRVNFSAPGGTPLPGFVPVNVTTSGGIHLTALSVAGSFSLLLPKGTRIFPSLNATVPITGANGVTEYTTFSVPSGTSCTLTGNLTNCPVRLHGVPNLWTVRGSVSLAGYPGPLSGNLTLVGPSPSLNATRVSFTGSAYAATLFPGLYQAYVTSGSGSAMLAAVATIAVSYGSPFPMNLTVRPAWTDTLSLGSGSSGLASTAEVRWTGPNGENITFLNEPVGTAIPFSLPAGTWTVRANGTASPFGIPTPVSANATVNLASGNAATALELVPVFNHQVSISVAGLSQVTVLPGAKVSLSLVLRDTGNGPVSFHLTGAPSTWTFNFTPENFSLGVGPTNSSATAEVVIHVPAGAPTNHPPISLEAIGSSGLAIGVASPSPTIDVLPQYGVRIGAAPNLGTVGSNSTTVPFYLEDSGNAPEFVLLSITNASALASIGWSSTIQQATAPVHGPVSLAPAQNSSYVVLLSSTTKSPIHPTGVEVLATVLNVSGGVTASVLLPVSTLTVTVSNQTLTVVGPSIGSPPAYPDWLFPTIAFAPALGLVGFGFLYRWYRSRRWVRR